MKKKKNMQTRLALFVVLAAFSILPGCGKKNSGDPGAVVGGGPVVGTIQGIGGNGSCASVGYNTSTTLTFSGTLNQGYTGLVAQLPVYGYGATSGGFSSNYYRNNVAGDSLNVYVSGAQAYAVVTLGVNTVNAIIQGQQGYSGTGQVCGLDINASIVPGGTSGQGWSGTIGGGVIKMWANGRWVTYANGQPILL